MLTSLHIENIAVIKSIDIDFAQGFSALTGETGAGKSIIIDSINLLLGNRFDKELIRRGESTAMVSGLFSDLNGDCKALLTELGVSADEDGSILVQRSVSQDGRSQIRINGRAASLSVLRAVSHALVNIHGQSDTHALSDSATHVDILDKFSGTEELLCEYRTHYSAYERYKRELHALAERESERLRYIEMLEYQIADIDALALTDGEEEELIDKKLKIKNSERITKQATFIYKALKGGEKINAAQLIERSIASLSSLGDCIPDFEAHAERLRDVLSVVEDIAEEACSALDGIDGDPTEKLNDIESRLDKISRIKRKYGLTVKDVLLFREKAAAELETYKNSDDIRKDLEAGLDKSYKAAAEIARRIHELRAKNAEALEKEICAILEFLDMPKVVFIAGVKECYENGELKLNPSGADAVEFCISANRGADPKPISKIASGGELARIMLALKSVIADKDGVMTIVFDEIDAGVSGKTARKIGIKMKQLSHNVQLLCVTHSAQIASLADAHFLISKSDIDGMTTTAVSLLDEEGRIAELSRILGGINVTESQRAAACDMLAERNIYTEQ